MAIRKVKAGTVYCYNPALLDRLHGPANVRHGEKVRVVNLHGCPPANTMGHCYVETVAGELLGLVQTASLATEEQYREYLMSKIAESSRVGQETDAGTDNH